MPLDISDGSLVEQVSSVIRRLFFDHFIVHPEVVVLVSFPGEVVGTGRVLTVEGVKASVGRGLVEIAETLRCIVTVSGENVK